MNSAKVKMGAIYFKQLLSREESFKYFITVWKGALTDDKKKKTDFCKLTNVMLDHGLISCIKGEDGSISIVMNRGLISDAELYSLMYCIFYRYFNEKLSLSSFVKIAQSLFLTDGKGFYTMYNRIKRHYNHQPPAYLYDYL